jgi:hypothetical protein
VNRRLIALLLPLSMIACAHDRARPPDQLSLYRAQAGEPVASFRYSERNLRWAALDNQSMVFWAAADQAYLVSMAQRCPDLDVANAIEITSRMRQVTARWDGVTVISRPGAATRARMPCRIDTIRPLNLAAVDGPELQTHEAQMVESDTGAGAPATP